ncbi:MAG: hypothetical protein VXU46_05815, partial [Planctomycetota bacterium]|nr:hypothetical protein [Planctomycetota bacterium]
ARYLDSPASTCPKTLLTELEKYQLRELVSDLEDSISDNTSNEMSLSRVIESIDAVFKIAAH